ncbi:MAG: cysteine hydrolase [Spirochaetaceae bacterium]|nr:MAG: cysteine hydrolase [Spirochaetaceae bacterium]
MAETNLPFTLDLKKAALVVVDMQNDFVRRGAPFFLQGCNEAIPNVQKVLHACRKTKVPVVFLKFTAGPSETLIWTWSKPLHPPDKACWKNCSRFYEEIQREAEGHDIIDELYPVEGEGIVEKYSYGGFYETNLHAILQARHAKQLIIVGCAAPFCIDDTVTGAFDRQYRNFVVSDAIGYFDKEFLASSLRRISMKYARVVTTKELLAEMGV